PRAVSDRDRRRRLDAATTILGVERMQRGDEMHAGTDLHVVPDPHLGGVEHDRAVIDEGPRADSDVLAVVALKWRHDLGAITDRSQQLTQDGAARSRLTEARRVEA